MQCEKKKLTEDFCQWMHFFYQASDGMEKQVHPLDECGVEYI